MTRILALAPLQVAQAVVGLGAIAIFTRLMSADEFGLYALALSISMLAHTLLFTWAEASAFRFFTAARAVNRLPDHFATLIGIVIALSIGAAIGVAALIAFGLLAQDYAALIVFVTASAALRCFTRLGRESDRAALAIARYAALETLYLALGFAIGVALLLQLDLGAAAPFAGLACAGAVVAFIDAPRLYASARGGRATLTRAASYAAYGLPLALALAVDLGVQAGARFILLVQAGSAEVGAYAAAFGLARPLDLLFMAAGAMLSPLLLNAYDGDRASVDATARTGVTVMAAIGIPAAAGLALIAAPLSALLVGDALSAEAARALPWLALAGLASGFNLYYLSEAFQITRRTALRALVMLAPGAVQLALTAILAPVHGALGAAGAACVGSMIGTMLLWLVGRRIFALPLPRRALLAIASATAAMSSAVIVTSPAGLALQVLSGAGAYALVALVLDIAGVRTLAHAHVKRFGRASLSGPTHAN